MNPLLSTALAAAEAAARVHLRHFRRVGLEGAREKGPSDFVSLVDTEAQTAALHVIRSRHPDHHILAEEGDEEPNRMWPEDGSFLWIVDPLDGTTNFLHGHPFFCASVGVGRRQDPWQDPAGPRISGYSGILEAGAVVAPRTGERWWASRGAGAWKNGKPISVSRIHTMGHALVGTGFPFKRPELVPRYTQELARLLPASGGVRRAGSAAMDLCQLAEGTLEAFWEEDYLSPWDMAAGLAILSEAGGCFSRLDGTNVDLANGSLLAANSPAVMEKMARLLATG